MHNFKPGQIYVAPANKSRREILFVTEFNIITRNEETQTENMWPKREVQHWVLAPEVKKLYVSVWKNRYGYIWSISYPDKQTYDKFTKAYNLDNYTLLKEYVLEYEDKDEVR